MLENSYPDQDLSLEAVNISLENIPYPIYYRQYGIRRSAQLQSPTFHELTDVSLPKDAIYHYNPESPLLFGPLETNPWYKSDTHLKFISHISDYAVIPQGPVVKKPVATQQYVQAYRRKHRTLKLLRDFFGINRQPNMLIIRNYCLLNHVYRYKPNMLLKYYRFYNFYATIMRHIDDDGNKSDRQQFFEVRLPKKLLRRNTFNQIAKDYSKGVSRRTLKFFDDDDSLLLLHLWMWLGPQRQYSIFNKISLKNFHKVNLIITDNGRYTILNLGEVDKWRNGQDDIDNEEIDTSDMSDDELEDFEKGERPERIQVKFYMLLEKFFNLRTESTVKVIDVPKYDLNDTSEIQEDEETDTTADVKIQQPHQDENSDANIYATTSQPDETNDDSDTLPEDNKGFTDIVEKPSPKVNKTRPPIPALPDEELVLDNEEDFEPVVYQPQSKETDGVIVVNDPTVIIEDDDGDEIEIDQDQISQLNDYEKEPLEDAMELLQAGYITAKEYKRYEALAQQWKKTPSPYDPNLTLEEYMKIPEQDTMKIEPVKIPDNDFVIDKSMLTATTEGFHKQYIEKVYKRNIVQSVMSLQKSGYIVQNIEREEKKDPVSNYEILSVKVQKIGGKESTIKIKLPIVDEEGFIKSAGVKYRLLLQRGDVPIRKVSPTEVSLTSYYGKLFIEKSERRTFNVEKYLQTMIQAGVIDGDFSNVVYKNVFNKRKTAPAYYQLIAKRFKAFDFIKDERSVSCYFDYETRAEHFKLDEATLTDLEIKFGGTLFATSINNSQDRYFLSPTDNLVYSRGFPEGLSLDKFFKFTKSLPLEMAEFHIFSKMIPIGIVLGYYLGITKLCQLLDVKPRKVFRGQRMNLTEHEYAIRFADESWIFDRRNYKATLILSGFEHYRRYIAEYAANQFDEKDTYGAVLRDAGLGSYQEVELKSIQRSFIDEITRTLLIEMKEPTEFVPLLIRAVELLTTMYSNDEVNMEDMLIKGYQRIAGHVYRELQKAIKADTNKRNGNRLKLEMSPDQVFRAIMTDSSMVIADDINPIHQIKEQTNVTFTGDGGRSKRSMVSRTRAYHETDIGVISEATVDNSNVAVTTYLSSDPSISSVYGLTSRTDPKTATGPKLLSVSATLAPMSAYDDRVN